MNGLPKRGMALITALVLMVVMTTLAIQLFSRLSQQTMLATDTQRYQQASWYLTSAESLALATLRQHFAHTERPWAEKTLRFPVPQGSITATLSDGQRCFNINALANSSPEYQAQARKQLVALLSLLAVPALQAEAFTDALRQLINPPEQGNAGILLSDISELRAITGMDTGLYKTIAPFMCALPQTRLRININTLNEQQSVVLAALFAPELRVSQARALIQQRPKAGWESIEQFLNQRPFAQIDGAIKMQLKNDLSVQSHYFLVRAEIHFAEVALVSRSLISRVAEQQFSVLWHQTGEIE
ncbi:type II secretion system minor pseudopilin GspK [Vagococcus sp. WN89Y]|uniref:type II secretion system minor pseudopilin GspK n=1 Tax=Vagococcus sp. WN89Y TaxID=3457258 RepID=UPI003FCCC1D5